MAIQAPDLTQQPPRSPRARLGGFVVLPRMLDKGRATLAGKSGEYHYACPLDHRFLDYVGINPNALKKELAKGKGDGEILAWIQANAKHKLTEPEIAAWSALVEQRAPADSNRGRTSTNSNPKPRPSGKISSRGSTCLMWTTT